MEKLHVSASSGYLQVLTNFLPKRVLRVYNMPNPRGNVEISTLPRTEDGHRQTTKTSTAI